MTWKLMHATLHAWAYLLLVSCVGVSGSQENSKKPVVVFDKEPGPLAQNFRLEIFRDGRVLYKGRYRVKQIGETQFYVSPEKIRYLFEELERLEVGSYVPVRGVSIAEIREDFLVEFAYKDFDRRLRLNAVSNPEFSLRVEEAMERFVPTGELRCPYIVYLGPEKLKEELCFLHDQTVSVFLGKKINDV